MSNKKIIWIDVGTHKAQEYMSIFGPNYWFYYKISRRVVSAVLLRRGIFMGLKKLNILFKTRKKLRKLRSYMRVVFIEANAQLFRFPEYREADDIFCLALSDEEESNLSLTKLYCADNDRESQGNSIYDTKHNISLNKFILCPKVSSDQFAREYKLFLEKKYDNYQIVLRLNCEGAEDAVIYAFSKYFPNNFNLILGSLKDVLEVKGKNAHESLMNHIGDNNLNFIDFKSHPDSWLDAYYGLLQEYK